VFGVRVYVGGVPCYVVQIMCIAINKKRPFYKLEAATLNIYEAWYSNGLY